jgi:hypothetical protein
MRQKNMQFRVGTSVADQGLFFAKIRDCQSKEDNKMVLELNFQLSIRNG